MPTEIPRDRAPAFNPNVSFGQGADEMVGLLQVSRAAQQRKKQEHDIEALSAVLGTDLKTMEALKVLGQYKLGIAKANAATMKAQRQIALDDMTGQFIQQVSRATPEQFELLRRHPNFNEALANSDDLRTLTQEKEDQILFNSVGNQFVDAVKSATTKEELNEIAMSRGFNYIKGKYSTLQDAYDLQFELLNPPEVIDRYETNPDGTPGQYLGKQIVFADGTSKLDTTKAEGFFTTDREEADRVSGGVPYDIVGVNEKGETIYQVKKGDKPTRRRQPIEIFTGPNAKEEGLARLDELLQTDKTAYLSRDPESGELAIFSIGTTKPMFGADLFAPQASDQDKANIAALPGFDPVSGTLNGQPLTAEQAEKLESGTRYVHRTKGPIFK